jgi:hypothetical protein
MQIRVENQCGQRKSIMPTRTLPHKQLVQAKQPAWHNLIIS